MKVLVTGGTGFIGSYVVDRLLDDGHEVLIFSRTRDKIEPRDGVEHFWGDIRDQTSVFEAMAHADSFIHLAGVLGTQETIQNPLPAILTNLPGGINVLEAAARYNVPGVNIAVGNFWENNPYSITKNSVERFVKMYNSYRGTVVSTVRAMNAYGPRQSVAAPYGSSKVRKIMPSFIHKALAGTPIEVYGDGSQIMDMVYVTDVADVLVDTLYMTLSKKRAYTDVEVGTGVETSVRDIAIAVLTEVSGTRSLFDWSSIPDPGISLLPMRAGETAARPVMADLSTLVPLYGQYPKGFVSLQEGVRKTVEYYKNV